MMTLISLAIVVAFVTSWAGTLGLFEVEIWWELATLITIMLLGHWLEMRSIAQARGALRRSPSCCRTPPSASRRTGRRRSPSRSSPLATWSSSGRGRGSRPTGSSTRGPPTSTNR